MQRKRNIQQLILLGTLLVATIAAFFLFRKGGEATIDPSIFRVADFNKVDQIVLTKDSKTIDLKFDGFRWKANDKLADRRMIDVLFATLQQATPKRPVGESVRDSVDNLLKEHGVQVRLFVSGELQKEFTAGGNASKTQAYFKDTDDQSFVMVIPGYRVYTSGIFELNENGWKDKYVFNFNWKNFQTLKANFPLVATNDFEIKMGKDYFEVQDVASSDTTRLNDFLDAISLLTVDEYVDKQEIPGYDSITSAKPVVNLVVQDISGKTYSLVLFEIGDKGRVLGVIQGAQPAFFDKRKIATILKNKSWFIKR